MKSLFKIFCFIVALDALFFIALMATSMSDEPPLSIAKKFCWILQNIMGFPLVLFNKQYPFFLDRPHFSIFQFWLIILNNTLLTFMIWWVIKGVKYLYNYIQDAPLRW